jgi:hypothetical protein
MLAAMRWASTASSSFKPYLACGWRLLDIAVFVRAGTRRHVAVLAENTVSGHEHIAGAIDQPITCAGDIFAVAGVVAIKRPVAAEMATVCFVESVAVVYVAVTARNGKAERAGRYEQGRDKG